MYQQRSRHNEKGAIPFRSGRFYSADSAWWFAVRCGHDQGPFPTRSSAQQALIEYLNDKKYLMTEQISLSALTV